MGTQGLYQNGLEHVGGAIYRRRFTDDSLVDEQGHALPIAASVFELQVLRELERVGEWHGDALALLERVEKRCPPTAVAELPLDGREMVVALRRMRPVLDLAGWTFVEERRERYSRMCTMRRRSTRDGFPRKEQFGEWVVEELVASAQAGGGWRGPVSELVARWPGTTPRSIVEILARYAPKMRALGWECSETGKRVNGSREYAVRRVGEREVVDEPGPSGRPLAKQAGRGRRWAVSPASSPTGSREREAPRVVFESRNGQ